MKASTRNHHRQFSFTNPGLQQLAERLATPSAICSMLIIFMIFLFAGCHTDESQKQGSINTISSDSTMTVHSPSDSTDQIVKSIIEIAANDFYKNQRPLPVAFRDVKIRLTIKSNKEALYILCGEFTTKDKEDSTAWIHFTTIRNSDYEQWIGANGLGYCENAEEIPYSKADLAEELWKQLKALEANATK